MNTLRRVVVWVSLAALPGGCLGGQTGQPSSAQCEDTRSVDPNETFEGLTVAEIAHAFEGHYSATLQWFKETPNMPSQPAVAFDDSVVIDVTYDGGKGQLRCGTWLHIPMRMDASTTASILHDSGVADLTVYTTAPATGSVAIQGKHAYFNLEVGDGMGASAAGTVLPADGGAPGTRATFPELLPPVSAGTGGTGGGGP